MRFLRRNADEAAESTAKEIPVEVSGTPEPGRTPGKGRPTPKRREAETKRRGPVAPPPKTQREALKRMRQSKTSKEERRAAAALRRERMMAGDDKYLLPRDRGPVKAYIRDVIDSRRNLMGLFMPLAILVFVALLVPSLVVQQYATLATSFMLLAMIVEGVILGVTVTRRVRAKFPKEKIGGLSVGWYSFIRASQLRKLRVPKPRVGPGTKID
ncbi:DUF3043 domain-containing protein [Actinosynnema mirum]|uniref:Integral membrane protein n=1 Tax=Actinosynnema mirum (strain ATCC 29888 / DSM 43827 / JCM 3225 / NBRC 14064 / NCIMB 13271 / NRRL B-12336 / IMRU 3971 / 101) TaxID=446462 RepID=C6W9F2_ACTMD|nr:DUF3043 domain-containing protein [Actinosynnema mirum]ACU35315.1 hypothetical protein Amir_1363 [Actinosynnema mirum DSM 43827]